MRRLIKISVAAAAIAIVSATVWMTKGAWLPLFSHRSLSSLPLSLPPGTRITMQSPRLSGYTDDGRRYEISADSVVQDFTSLEMTANQPRIRLEMTDGTKLELSATTGVTDRDMNTFTMHGDVVLATETTREIHLLEAVIDLHNKTITSEKPFEITSDANTIRGDRLEVHESGAIVIDKAIVVRADSTVQIRRYAFR